MTIFLDWFKFKAYADNKLNVAHVFDIEENILGKGQNAGYHHFLLIPQCFQKASFSGSIKSGLCGKKLINKSSMEKKYSMTRNNLVVFKDSTLKALLC